MRLAAYLLAPLLGAAVPALAQVQPVPGTPAARTDADALADVVRRVGRSPRDLGALIEAGDLSFRVGDVTAAAAFYKRAEAIDPNNGRVKAGVARILVNGEHPGEALRFFALAERQGAPMADYAGDRGFAYDLIGEQERAQRDYRLALSRAEDEEVRRRYALSLGISGRQEEALAQIDTLLRQSDRGAWRARAFILAMSGDTAGASRIATSMMPRGMASGLDAFFRRLPTLSPADRAFAVHFGEVVATPERVADARLVPPLPALGADPYAPRGTAPVQVAAAPVEDRRTRRAREREPRRTALAANDRPSAATAPWGVARAAPSTRPAPPVAATAPQQVAATSATPPPTGASRSLSAAATAPQQVAAISTTPPPTGASRSLSAAAAAPQQVAATSTTPPSTAASRSLAAAALAARGPATVPPVVAPVRSSVPPVASPVAAASPVAVASAPATAVRAAGTNAASLAPATPSPTAASPATSQVARAATAPSLGSAAAAQEPVARTTAPQVANATPVPPPEASASASLSAAPAPATQVVAATPPPSPVGAAPAAATPAELATVAQAAEPAPAPAPQLAAATPVPPRMSEDSILARIVAGLSVPASELGVAPMPGAAPPPEVAATATTVPLEQAAARAERNVVADEAKRERLTAARDAERAALAQDAGKRPAKAEPKRVARADPKALDPKKPDSKKTDAKKPDAKKPGDAKADPKKKAPAAEPARIWVQVAGGANEGDLPRAWKDVQAKTPALAGRAAYSTPLRATNRVVTGPFKTEAEARAMVNKLSKQGLSAFTFTSEAGQTMKKLGAK